MGTTGKKLLFVDEHKIVNYAGGVEKVICSFANEFLSRGWEPSIVCMDLEKGMPLYQLESAVHFVNLAYDKDGNLDFGGIPWFWKKLQKELLRTFAGPEMRWRGKKVRDPKQEYYFDEFIRRLELYMEETRPDVVLAISADSAYLAQRAMGGKNIPVIAMCHTDPSQYIGIYDSRQMEAWRQCRCVQVLMESFAAPMEKAGVSHVVRIPNAVMQVSEEEVRDLSQCRKRIITVGRIDGSVKRQHLLVEAFSHIAEKYPDWSVHIYGNVANQRYKKRMDRFIREHHLEEQVVFEGVTHDMKECLHSADIFVFPSVFEGFGLALVEAMSMGLPVIGCEECTAVNELIEHDRTGLLSKADSRSLSEHLIDLIEHPELRIRLGKEAHESAKQYAPERVWKQWETLLNEIVG